jgi:exopolysaccharide biosynthesis polyprenyl glycosylphosphotransferase
MLKQQSNMLRRIAVMLDLVILTGSFLLAYYLRCVRGSVDELEHYVWVLMFAVPIWFALCNHFRIYSSLRYRKYFNIIWAIFKVHVAGGLALSAIVFVLDPHHFSRFLLGLFLLISFLLMTVVKVLIKKLLVMLRRNGYNFKNILVIGGGQDAMHLSELIKDHDEWGLKIKTVMLVPVDADGVPAMRSDVKFSTLDEIIEMCKSCMIDEVVITLDRNNHFNIEPLVDELQALGLTVRVVIDMLSIPGSKKEVSLFFNEIPMLSYSNFSLNSDQMLAKNFLDLFGGLVGIMLNLVMLPFLAMAIKLDSPGPIFFGQRRIGEHGREFTCWKYRTMHVDAEAQKQKLMAQNEMKGAMFKIRNDPRVTRVGRFLRKSSLDEFPQFWNVLKGDMSLVGTRPPTPDEVATYQNWHRRRISIKPGITGLWQISGRNQVQDFDDVVRLDIRYIEEWSIWLDIRILLKTPLVMVMRKGAS